MFVAPHNKVARDVTDKDLKTVFAIGSEMHKACNRPFGLHTGGLAIAHPQIEEKDPMRFFVTANGDCIINPVITNHTKHKRRKLEACLSFPIRKEAGVMRYYKMEVEFYVFDDLALLEDKQILVKKTAKLKGLEAQVWQHELQHLDGINVWGEYGEEHTLGNIIKVSTPPPEEEK